jgi:BirA family transcriptional regulator, biotin operon repressor / biotin---[acetyl-CoA-carboxylase] ligase
VNRYSDLDRPALLEPRLASALAPDGFEVTVLEETESTNAVVAERARAGAPEGTVVVAELQTSGRGRQGRTWTSPPRAGLTFSVLLRPPQVSGWLPLLAGLSVAVAVGEQGSVKAGVKWPNDVLIEDTGGAGSPVRPGKVAGVLTEVTAGGAVVIGIGLNVTTRLAELPDERATSLALAGARSTDRETILKAILRSLSRAYASWRADPAALVPAYRSACVSIGKQVRVELPGGESYEGTATDVDGDGRLIVGDRAFAAGDVVHLR